VFNAGNGLFQIQLEELPCLEPILDFDEPSAASSAASAAATAPASAVLSAQGEDPDILALSLSMKALGIDTTSACLKFAIAIRALCPRSA
jgi:hypothetical protein